MIKIILRFFDKFEDHSREHLSRYPIVYTFIGGFAIVLFWRGVWMTADLLPWLDGPTSIIISSLVLLATGLFVSFFVTDKIIASGIKQEKKMVEKTESEVRQEGKKLDILQDQLTRIESEVMDIESKIDEEQEAKAK